MSSHSCLSGFSKQPESAPVPWLTFLATFAHPYLTSPEPRTPAQIRARLWQGGSHSDHEDGDQGKGDDLSFSMCSLRLRQAPPQQQKSY